MAFVTSRFSRRQFLQRTGLLSIGLSLPPTTPESETEAVAALEPLVAETHGRAFSRARVFAQPDSSSVQLAELQSDSVHVLTPAEGWYQVANGFVPRESMQPIAPYTPPALINLNLGGVGVWAEVVVPVTAVRKWCDVHAPMVARLGFGAVVTVIDQIVDDRRQVWYGLSAAPGMALAGWVIAAHFAECTPMPLALQNPSIQIDTSRSALIVYDGNQVVGAAPVSGNTLQPAKTFVMALSRTSNGPQHELAEDENFAHLNSAINLARDAVSEQLGPFGLPYLMVIGDMHYPYMPLFGTYWHNQSGFKHTAKTKHLARSVMLSTLVAKRVYELLEFAQRPVPLEIL
jgi:hypothetical protein